LLDWLPVGRLVCLAVKFNLKVKIKKMEDEGPQLVGLPHEVIEALFLSMRLREMVALGLTCRQLHALVCDNRSQPPPQF
jgi:hypothetical protein